MSRAFTWGIQSSESSAGTSVARFPHRSSLRMDRVSFASVHLFARPVWHHPWLSAALWATLYYATGLADSKYRMVNTIAKHLNAYAGPEVDPWFNGARTCTRARTHSVNDGSSVALCLKVWMVHGFGNGIALCLKAWMIHGFGNGIALCLKAWMVHVFGNGFGNGIALCLKAWMVHGFGNGFGNGIAPEGLDGTWVW